MLLACDELSGRIQGKDRCIGRDPVSTGLLCLCWLRKKGNGKTPGPAFKEKEKDPLASGPDISFPDGAGKNIPDPDNPGNRIPAGQKTVPRSAGHDPRIRLFRQPGPFPSFLFSRQSQKQARISGYSPGFSDGFAVSLRFLVRKSG